MEKAKKGFWSTVFGTRKSDCCNVKIEELPEEDDCCSTGSPCCAPVNAHNNDPNTSSMTLKVYEPAPCCPACESGAKQNPLTAGFESDLVWLESNGATIERYKSGISKSAFTDDRLVVSLLKEHGTDSLPVFVVDGKIMLFGRYPKREELADWLNLRNK